MDPQKTHGKMACFLNSQYMGEITPKIERNVENPYVPGSKLQIISI